MKRIVIVLAMLALVFGPAFAQVAIRAEIGTNIVDLNFDDIGASEYFTTNDYEDTKIEFNLASDMFGAQVIVAYSTKNDDPTKAVQFEDVHAWAKFGSFAKIKVGMFNDRIGANRNHDVIDEYKLGILQYRDESTGKVFGELAEGDRLQNFVADAYVGPVTLQFMMHPYLSAASNTPNYGYVAAKNLHIGGRVRAGIGDILNITVNAIYNNNSGAKAAVSTITWTGSTPVVVTTPAEFGERRTTLAAFFEFPNLAGIGLDLVAGYTMMMWRDNDALGNIKPDSDGIDHGIDLRFEIPFGDFVLAMHNNLSIYGPKVGADEKKEMVLYDEIEVEYDLTDDMEIHAGLRSSYYDAPNDNDSIYDLAILLGFQYTLFESTTLEVGLEVKNIGNDDRKVMLGIPFRYTFWY